MAHVRMVSGRSVAVVAVLALATALAAPAGAKEISPEARTARRSLVFPVVGPTTYRAGFGDCRDQCRRRHEGTDVMAPRLALLVAARVLLVMAGAYDGTMTGEFACNA